MRQERIERYIRSRRTLEYALHAIRPEDCGTMVQYGVKFLMLGVSESVLAAFDKIRGDRTAFGYLDQYIAPERVVAKVKEFNRLQQLNISRPGHIERLNEWRELHAGVTKSVKVAHERLMSTIVAKRGISDSAQVRASMFLFEYVTDRPNLRGKSVFEIEQTAFKIFSHLPGNLIEFCTHSSACEENYRMLDPWVGLNRDLIKTEI